MTTEIMAQQCPAVADPNARTHARAHARARVRTHKHIWTQQRPPWPQLNVVARNCIHALPGTAPVGTVIAMICPGTLKLNVEPTVNAEAGYAACTAGQPPTAKSQPPVEWC